MKKQRHISLSGWAVHLALLLLSGAIYFFFRPPEVYLNVAVERLWPSVRMFRPSLSQAHMVAALAANPFGYFFVFTLPSVLWSAGAVSLIRRLCPSNRKVSLLPLAYVAGLELMQYSGVTDGTFDPVDLASVPLSGAFGWLLVRFAPNRTEQKKPQRELVALIFCYIAVLILADKG